MDRARVEEQFGIFDLPGELLDDVDFVRLPETRPADVFTDRDDTKSGNSAAATSRGGTDEFRLLARSTVYRP
jgi:hypothetical protein